MRTFPDRGTMIRELVPPGGVYAEIGVFRGDFSRELVDILHPTQLVLLDLFDGVTGSGDADGNHYQTADMNKVYERLKQWEVPEMKLFMHRGDSSTTLGYYPDATFDMVYIDGDHSYEGCKKDLEVAWNKVKSGGWIMGHDYEMNLQKAHTIYHFGVKRAVDEFCQNHAVSVEAKGLDGCVSYAIRRT